MATIVGQEHRVVGRHVDAVRPRILPLAPRAQKIAGTVEHHHRVLAAIEDVDIVVAVDADPADLLERPALGQFGPVGVDLVFELACPDDHHCLSLAAEPTGRYSAAMRSQVISRYSS